MSQIIKLNLVPSIIMEAVKGETFIKGKIDKASAEGAEGVAFNETAGDEKVHERKLLRTMHAALEELKTYMGEYLDEGDNTQGDNVVSEIDSANDTLTISLVVSDRFNKAFTRSLAYICSSYIENKMLELWYITINANQAGLYTTLLSTDKTSLKRCFAKTAPVVPETKYTDSIYVEDETLTLQPGEEVDVEYDIDEGRIDDVECSVTCPIARVKRSGYKMFTVKAVERGEAFLVLMSHHNSDVARSITIKVAKYEKS